MTLTEVLLASTLLVVLLTLVAITMSVITNVSGTVSSQYQEYDQALPALAPLQKLLRAEVEPGCLTAGSPPRCLPDGAPRSNGVPTPGFAQYVDPTLGPISLNFAVQFYSNIGTTYNNLTKTGHTAGPAKIVALEVDQSGNPVTSSTSCTIKSSCSFQVRRYLPLSISPPSGCTDGSAAPCSSCPVAIDGSSGPCQYPSTYTLITDAQRVINNPSDLSTTIFSYSMFDPDWPAGAGSTGTSFVPTPLELQADRITPSTYGYPNSTPQQTLTVCAAVSANYPTTAIACPLDAVQSVGIDLMVGVPGSGTNGTVDNQTIVYRYPPTGSGSSTVYPYQWPSAAG